MTFPFSIGADLGSEGEERSADGVSSPWHRGAFLLGLVVTFSAFCVVVASSSTPMLLASLSAESDLAILTVELDDAEVNAQTFEFSGTVSVRVVNHGDAPTTAPVPITVFIDQNQNQLFDPSLDVTLLETEVGLLESAEEANVSGPVVGVGRFRNEPIWAIVDPENVLGETSRFDNVRSAGAECRFLPVPGRFRPIEEWHWKGDTVLPDFNQVVMAPVVIDLDLDGIPEVVFSSFDRDDRDGRRAVIRVVRGDSGEPVWTSDPDDGYLHGMGSLAAGDLNGDGRPEIVGISVNGLRVLAFDADGELYWTSGDPGRGIGHTSPNIVDLDHDGVPEIIASSFVFDADGNPLWSGTLGRAANSYPSVPIVSDLDSDGDPEILAGHTAYRADGTVLWHRPDLTDGFNAVADFDLDQRPEVVLVTAGTVYLLRGIDGATIWGPSRMPAPLTMNNGGPPVIADVDSDGLPEIGVAGGTHYVVFETDGSERWRMPIVDVTSNRTASSVFDFDGDGSSEIVMRDEHRLWIFDGRDGSVIWSTRTGSSTTVELPVIADVDADGNAEIVNPSNNFHVGGNTGISVYGDADDNWVPTRAIWNQHSYHVTNVNDDGSIPRYESPSWAVENSYRTNVATGGGNDASPDISAGRLEARLSDSSAHLIARIGNAGSITTPPNIRVAFYREPEGSSRELLGTVRIRERIQPGHWANIEVEVIGGIGAADRIIVAADDDGTGVSKNNECDETNNTHSERFEHLPVTRVPDPTSTVTPTPSMTAVPPSPTPVPIRNYLPRALRGG